VNQEGCSRRQQSLYVLWQCLEKATKKLVMEVQGAVEIRDVEPGEWGTGVPTLHLEDRCLDKDLEGSHRGLFTDNSLALNSKRNNQNRGGPQIFQKSRRICLKIPGIRMVTRSHFHAEEPKMLGASV